MNAIFNLPLYLRVSLLAAAAVTLWLVFDEPKPSQSGQPKVERSSDYGMTNFKMTVMDLQGRPSRVIEGTEASHYPADDSTEIFNPVTLFIAPEKDDWILTSDQADTQGKAEHIVLTGNVVIINKDDPQVQLLTDLLNLDTVNNTAYTEHPVIIRSPHGDTHSVGFHAALKEQTINLHSRVRGQYNAPATN